MFPERSVTTASRPCAVVAIPGRGRGVAATRSIRRGEIVLVFGGPVVPRERLSDFTYVLEFAPGLFLGPSGDVDDLVNHSCDPNCAVEADRQGARLRAVRRIARGAEITFDYSTTMLTDPTSFPCACGAVNCRGVVTAWSRLAADLREEYRRRGMVPSFVITS